MTHANTQEKPFRFADYKKVEEAKAELLKRHPLGSDVSKLVETLKGAKAKCTSYVRGGESFYRCYYQHGPLNWMIWIVVADYDDAKHITRFYINHEYDGL